MPPPLRILQVHNDYQRRGGERTAIDAQTRLLRERGHTVLLYGRSNQEIGHFGLMEKAAFFPRAIYSRRTYAEIRALAAAERPDVAHVHNVFPLMSPAVYRALKDAAVPIVQTVYNFRLMCPNGLFYTHGQVCERCKHGNMLHAVRWRCYRNSYVLSGLYAASIGLHRRHGTFDLIDRYLAPTEFTARQLVEGGVTPEGRVDVVRYFVPDPLPELGPFEHREAHFVYLGRLSSEKGLWTLLAAIRHLPHVRLRMLGEGPLEGSIRAHLDDHHMSNVELMGFVDGQTKWDELRSATAVVVPSEWYENSPLSVIESLSVGTPVVASDIGSLPETVTDSETGLLFRLGDSQDLAAKLGWLAAHPKEAHAMGRRARQVAETLYSADRHYAQLLEVYRAAREATGPSASGN